MALLFPPRRVATDSSGNGYSGALLYVYQQGTTTPESIYSDSDLTTPLANPVVADSNGVFAPVYAAEDLIVDLAMKTAGGVTLYSESDVPVLGANGSSGTLTRDFTTSRARIAGSGGTTSFEAGPAVGDDTGGAGRIGGWLGTQADTLELDAAATSTTGTLTVAGAATLSSTLAVTGASTLSGATTVGSTLTTSGSTSWITERSKKLQGVVETAATSFSAASTVEITLADTPTGVRMWKVVVFDLYLSASAQLRGRFSFDSGSTFKSGATDYSYSYVEDGANTAAGTAAYGAFDNVVGGAGDADYPSTFVFYINTPASGGTARTTVWGSSGNWYSSGGWRMRFNSYTMSTLANYGRATTFQLYPGSGTMTGKYLVIPLRGYGE